MDEVRVAGGGEAEGGVGRVVAVEVADPHRDRRPGAGRRLHAEAGERLGEVDVDVRLGEDHGGAEQEVRCRVAVDVADRAGAPGRAARHAGARAVGVEHGRGGPVGDEDLGPPVVVDVTGHGHRGHRCFEALFGADRAGAATAVRDEDAFGRADHDVVEAVPVDVSVDREVTEAAGREGAGLANRQVVAPEPVRAQPRAAEDCVDGAPGGDQEVAVAVAVDVAARGHRRSRAVAGEAVPAEARDVAPGVADQDVLGSVAVGVAHVGDGLAGLAWARRDGARRLWLRVREAHVGLLGADVAGAVGGRDHDPVGAVGRLDPPDAGAQGTHGPPVDGDLERADAVGVARDRPHRQRRGLDRGAVGAQQRAAHRQLRPFGVGRGRRRRQREDHRRKRTSTPHGARLPARHRTETRSGGEMTTVGCWP